MMKKDWILYGANGYTGQLIAERAKALGQNPTLAGRRAAEIQSLAERLNLPYKVFDLSNPHNVVEGIRDFVAVLHCAGPFSATSRPMVDACLTTGTHYLDITGEIEVFERIHSLNAEAVKTGVVLIPGVGFDVVPTDCLAAELASRLPQAVGLEMAFATDGGISPGTLKTAIEGFAGGGKVRRSGKIISVPPAKYRREIPFSHRRLNAVSIPWGDVSTAYYSTGIPDITFYAAVPRSMARMMKLAGLAAPVFSLGVVQKFLKALVDKKVKGPSEEIRKKGKTHLWGRVVDINGKSVEITRELMEGYLFTSRSALEAVRRVVEDKKVSPGAWTPSKAFGAQFVDEV